MPERYIIQYLQYPSIIDDEYSYPKIMFSGTNVIALTQVCYNYNTIKDYTFGQACQDYRDYINSQC
jgi:hypothetical protein